MLHPSHSPPQAAVDPLATAKADLLSKFEGLKKAAPVPATVCPPDSSTPTYCPAVTAPTTPGTFEVEPAWTGGCVSLATGAVLRSTSVRPTSAEEYRAINCGACGVQCEAKCQCRNGVCAAGNACVLGRPLSANAVG